MWYGRSRVGFLESSGRRTKAVGRSDEQHGGGCGRKWFESERMKDLDLERLRAVLLGSAAECVKKEIESFCFPFLFFFLFSIFYFF